MYRLIIESLLGVRLSADCLHFEPCLPADWQEFKLDYRYRQTLYRITVRQTPGAEASTSVLVDGVLQSGPAIALTDDRAEHRVEVNLRRRITEFLERVA